MSFEDDYYGNYGGLNIADYVDRHIRGSAMQMDRIRKTVQLVAPQHRTVLDVGAGHGVLLEELAAARGIKGVGIEITPSKVEYARSRGVDLRLGRAEELPFENQAFDTVMACEVIEHLPFGVYEKSLAELARVARHTVIISVPNEEQRPFVRCPYCGASVNPNYHFRSFSADSMRDLLSGFALRQIVMLGVHRSSPLLTLGRRLLDSSWPAMLVCASCGFRSQGAVTSAPKAESKASRLRDMAQRLSMCLPARKKSTWLVGVFMAAGEAASDSPSAHS